MASRVVFSGLNLNLNQAALHYNDMDEAIKLFFSHVSPSFQGRFLGYTQDDITKELNECRRENDLGAALNVLAAVEAAFRIDYLQRCYQKRKDVVSRSFQNLYRQKDVRASLEDEILEIWKQNTNQSSAIIGGLRGAFKFRHWMAHGRYWTPKLGQQYDYLSVYPIAAQALSSFPLIGV